jgi:hypothetical protein
MEDFPQKRAGVWYPKKDMLLFAIDRIKRRGINLVISRSHPIVFIKDTDEGHVMKSGHILYVHGSVYWIQRMNAARWSKKFER